VLDYVQPVEALRAIRSTRELILRPIIWGAPFFGESGKKIEEDRCASALRVGDNDRSTSVSPKIQYSSDHAADEYDEAAGKKKPTS
jgi:hypothetical protein